MCLIEIGLHAESMLTILSSVLNMIGGSIQPLKEHKNLHFYYELDIHMSAENYESPWLWAWLKFANPSQMVCFISSEKWVHREKYPNEHTSILVRRCHIQQNLVGQIPLCSHTCYSPFLRSCHICNEFPWAALSVPKSGRDTKTPH